MAERGLTPKQQSFVREYLVDLNITAAALRAGYSKRTAAQLGYQLMKNPAIQEAIRKAMDDRAKRTEVTQDKVLAELSKIAFASGTDFAKVVTLNIEKDGRPKAQVVELTDTDRLTQDQKAAISSIEETKFGIKVSTYDKVRALELLGKHLGMFSTGSSGANTVTEDDPITRSLKEDKANGLL